MTEARGTNWKSPPNAQAFLYAIRAGQYVKFGVSRFIEERIANMQIGCPEPMELLGKVQADGLIESLVHQALKADLFRSEWFYYRGRSREIADLIAAGDYPKLMHAISV
jgi:hypothetical protein